MTSQGPSLPGPIAPALARPLWTVVILLVLLGVASGVLRSVFTSDLVARIEPVRMQVLAALHLNDPFLDERPAELAQADGRLAAHPLRIVLHSVAGSLFLLAAPFQFSARVRSRHLSWHRWSGRILLLVAFPMVLTGMYFGILLPYGGPGEVVLIALVGTLFLVGASQAFVAIRRRQVARHREWMIRVFAIAISISTVRVAAAAGDLLLTPAGIRPPAIFVISLWIGWGLTLAAAELWIRYTRPLARYLAVPDSAV